MYYIHGNLNPKTLVIVSKGDTVAAKIADLRLSRHRNEESDTSVF